MTKILGNSKRIQLAKEYFRSQVLDQSRLQKDLSETATGHFSAPDITVEWRHRDWFASL